MGRRRDGHGDDFDDSEDIARDSCDAWAEAATPGETISTIPRTFPMTISTFGQTPRPSGRRFRRFRGQRHIAEHAVEDNFEDNLRDAVLDAVLDTWPQRDGSASKHVCERIVWQLGFAQKVRSKVKAKSKRDLNTSKRINTRQNTI